jgi:hypothetical protein
MSKQQSKVKLPSILDPDFRYIRADDTDILRTWKRQGWQPPTEYRTDYLFKQEKGA